MVEYSDGRTKVLGNEHGFLAFLQHPAVNPLLTEYDLGSNDSEAEHALILDRERQEIYIAPIKEAEQFLMEQWPPQPSIRVSQEEHVPKIPIALKYSLKEQASFSKALVRWLDKQLKK